MGEIVAITVKPKVESYNYEGHRYTLKFEPNASPEHRWSWMVTYTCVYELFGRAPTVDLAGRQARTRIRQLNKREDSA